ncbi:MAG TPA: serine protease [Burkholderiaceae bacterium]|nr:serine protease [Burkholderiaceae bacterium]
MSCSPLAVLRAASICVGLALPALGATRAAVPPAPARTAASAPAVNAAPVAPAPSASPPASAASSSENEVDQQQQAEPQQPPLSPAGQRVYESARAKLVQVRTLLKAQDSQSSVGSGFLVSNEGHLITNFHVVSTFALQPQNHRLVYATADGKSGALQLIDVDVVHDLALLKPVEPDAFTGRGMLAFRPRTQPLARGERLYSLGNPLDVGFAVTEGSYNGLVERSFVPTIFFGGSLSPGMSGGPALDPQGRVSGINVATRRDGEQVSFLVPANFAKELLDNSRNALPMDLQGTYQRLTRQHTTYQAALAKAFIALPWRNAGHARYAIPVPQEDFLRCWGRSTPPDSRGLDFERSDCNMDSRVYITSGFSTGSITVRHEAYDGRKLGPLRFAQRYSASFRNEFFGNRNAYVTAPQCHERFVDRGGLPLRAVICLRAHKKLKGLYDVSVLVATLDQSTAGVQGRFDGRGFTFDNAQRLAAHYLDGFGWTDRKTAAH